jgi:hypothetical protein
VENVSAVDANNMTLSSCVGQDICVPPSSSGNCTFQCSLTPGVGCVSNAGDTCASSDTNVTLDVPCAELRCDAQAQCSFATKRDNSSCPAADSCFSSGRCVAGLCKGVRNFTACQCTPETQARDCVSANPCTYSICQNSTCVELPTQTFQCDDGNACNGPDHCFNGACVPNDPQRTCGECATCSLGECELLPANTTCTGGGSALDQCQYHECDAVGVCTPRNTSLGTPCVRSCNASAPAFCFGGECILNDEDSCVIACESHDDCELALRRPDELLLKGALITSKSRETQCTMGTCVEKKCQFSEAPSGSRCDDALG